MYVRMSSNPQDYSIEHQILQLNQYALEQGFDIAMVYADAGKSGLRIDGRPGLQRLIADVQTGIAEFQTVLVYDVSRWGRFQDIDESAYYEFLCRQAGVQVIYCAEHFTNDHRIPVSQSGVAKAPLKPGERKPVATDRVVLAHSGAIEVAVVRRIYELYTAYGWTDSEIARQLQCEGHPTHLGHAWDNCTVRRILTNPRYCGEIVYNRTTRRLKGKMQANPQTAWIRCTGAVAPMVDRTTFDQAQEIRRRRATGPDRERVLRKMRAVFKRHGAINAKLCNASALPRRTTILKMFGSYSNAYVAAGLPLPFTERGALGFHRIRAWGDSMLLQVINVAQKAGATLARTAVWNVLLLNNAITVKVSIASTRRFEDGSRRWRVPISCGAKADFVICALMEGHNERIEAFLLFQTSTIGTASLLLSRNTLARYGGQSFRSLDEIFGMEDNVI